MRRKGRLQTITKFEGCLTVHLPHEIKCKVVRTVRMVPQGTIRTVRTNFHLVQKTIRCNSTSNAPDGWAYVPETYLAKNTSIKLPCCIKFVFHIISRVLFLVNL